MSFSIHFTNKPVPEGWDASFTEMAEIEISDFKESLAISTDYWQPKDYIQQWKDELTKFVSGEQDKLILIVEMYDPKHANLIKVWVVHREKEGLFVNNNIIFTSQIKGKFEINKIHDYISDRSTHNEDGLEISVWKTTEADVKNWLEQLKNAKD